MGQSVAAGAIYLGPWGSSANVSDGDEGNKSPAIETVPLGLFLRLEIVESGRSDEKTTSSTTLRRSQGGENLQRVKDQIATWM
jgi:hypothetical protein